MEDTRDYWGLVNQRKKEIRDGLPFKNLSEIDTWPARNDQPQLVTNTCGTCRDC